MTIKASNVKGLLSTFSLSPCSLPLLHDSYNKGHGFSHRLGSGTGYQSLPAIEDGSRPGRSLTRHQGVGTPPSGALWSRGEHRGTGKACYLAALMVLKYASTQLLLTNVSAGILPRRTGLPFQGPFHSCSCTACDNTISRQYFPLRCCAPPASVRSSSVRVGRREPRRLA